MMYGAYNIVCILASIARHSTFVVCTTSGTYHHLIVLLFYMHFPFSSILHFKTHSGGHCTTCIVWVPKVWQNFCRLIASDSGVPQMLNPVNRAQYMHCFGFI